MPEYGTALNFIFSKSTTVFGPSQVEAAINQDPEISAQRTLWGQQGSQVIMGNLLVVPIEDSLLYVQPLYLQSDQTKLPQLQRVIVFYRAPALTGGAATAAPSRSSPWSRRWARPWPRPLARASTAAARRRRRTVEGGGTGGGATAGGGHGGLSTEASALIARANQEFAAAQDALKAGDFAEYGRRIEALEQALSDLQRLQQQ